jgi:type VI secretion system protein ImpK
MARIIRHSVKLNPVRESPRSLLLEQLGAFALAIMRVIESHPNTPEPETPDQLQRAATNAAAAAVQAHTQLSDLLTAQGLEVSARGTEPERALAQEAKYLKVALADELLIHSAWAGQSAFLDHLLEMALFRTSRAGQEIVDRIERLLAGPSESASLLAPQYLFALNLGFEGRLRPLTRLRVDVDATRTVQELKQALFRLVHHRDPEPLHALQRAAAQTQRVASEQAYLHTLQNMVPVRNWRLSRAGAWMIGWAIALLLISQIGWILLSAPLRSAVKGVEGHQSGQVQGVEELRSTVRDQ